MKGWFKLLVLGAIPILAVTMVANQGLAADKGSQLIFIVDGGMGMQNFISVTNTSVVIPDLDEEGDVTDNDGGMDQMAQDAMAVTVLVQVYDDGLDPIVEYLRVITGGATVLIDPLDHMIPGTERNVSTVIGASDSSRYVLTVTAVGTHSADDDRSVDSGGQEPGVDDPVHTANILFPGYLVTAMELDGMQNIDASGMVIPATGEDAAVRYATMAQADQDDDMDGDQSTRNVGDLNVDNAAPVAFNYLAGHQAAAQRASASGGSDQTASWAVNALTRPALADDADTDDADTDSEDSVAMYDTLEGSAGQDRLAEKVHGGDVGMNTRPEIPSSETNNRYGDSKSGENNAQNVRGINHGALVWSSLHGGGAAVQQGVQFLSVADDYGMMDEDRMYRLIPAMTKYKVVVHDNAGGVYMVPDPADDQVFRGGEEDAMPMPSPDIVVYGIQVQNNAGDCGGDMMADGGYDLADLASLLPSVAEGTEDFMGLGMDDMGMDMDSMNLSHGWIKFLRVDQECKKDYGDEDGASLTGSEIPDDVPVMDERTFTTGTLIIENAAGADDATTAHMTNRVFVTTGQVILTLESPDSTFGASWMLTTK